ncbi:uncharacterized protein BX663DRAFT_268620 [Cokeromyces recurvatus]|uniref:uncharacterized protein n=1 Tax=Cokeromyces recurvatus TaxID=90255 RepID=UPI00221EC088|nr:uncharacterized protein BX663DRAFT_268620 [Cokeromyces recurvatus]KAI7898156.1 hypothetical protein BX663DRAFT_268620 [Cokeromyces recurvatus]
MLVKSICTNGMVTFRAFVSWLGWVLWIVSFFVKDCCFIAFSAAIGLTVPLFQDCAKFFNLLRIQHWSEFAVVNTSTSRHKLVK